ncbi:MAG: hypothetical protein N3A01_00135 [Bacteroidales bacterium]|nr:hypothetical protein [Bacteroidales bacterium]
MKGVVNMFINTLIVFFIFFNSIVHSQKIIIKDDEQTIGNGNNSCFIVTIPEAKQKDVLQAWKKLTKSYDAKVKGDNEQFADNAIIKKISENPIDIYSRFEEMKNGTIMIVGFDLGGAYLNKKDHSKQYKEAYDILYNFAKEQAIEAINTQINEQEKIIKNYENEINDKTKKINNLEEDIKKWTNLIEKAKKDIEDLKNEVERLKQEKLKEIENLKKINEKKNSIN